MVYTILAVGIPYIWDTHYMLGNSSPAQPQAPQGILLVLDTLDTVHLRIHKVMAADKAVALDIYILDMAAMLDI